MAISKVQGPYISAGWATSSTATYGATPTPGNLLIAILTTTQSTSGIGGASVTGFTLASSAIEGTGNGFASIWFKVAGASEPTNVDAAITGGNSSDLFVEEWTGLTAPALDQIASTNDSGGTVSSRSTGTTPATRSASELAIAAVAYGNTTSAQSWSNSFTDERSADTETAAFGSLVLTSTGTKETTLSWTTARRAGGTIATFFGADFASASDTVTLSESVTVEVGAAPGGDFSVSADDSITLSESTSEAITAQISSSDTVTLSENIGELVGTSVVVAADTVTLTETVSVTLPNALLVSVSDSVTLTEVVVVTLAGNTVSVSDTVTLSETTIENIGTSQISASDSITLTESITLEVKATISVSDSVAVSETASATTSTPLISSSDAIALSESISVYLQGVALNASASDTVTVNEADFLGGGFDAATASDTVTLSETVAAHVNAFSPLLISDSDNITLSESTGVAPVAINLSISDAVALSESDAVTDQGGSISVSDSITVSETTNLLLVWEIIVSDTVTVNEADFTGSGYEEIALSDSITLTETSTESGLSLAISESDLVNVIEYDLEESAALEITLSDNITVTETITVSVIAPPGTEATSVQDDITLTESSNQLISDSEISEGDTVTLSESTNTIILDQRAVSDNISLSENEAVVILAPITYQISVDDTVTLSEADGELVGVPENYASGSDTVTVTETILINIGSSVFFFNTGDSVVVSEFIHVMMIGLGGGGTLTPVPTQDTCDL